jgi:hypothetical protein
MPEDLIPVADLKNSRPLDVHRWSEHPEIRNVTQQVFDVIAPEIPKGADFADHKKHLRVLILDLYHRYMEDPDGWVGVSLNRNDYSGPRRYNKLFLSFRPMERLTRLLRTEGFIDWAKGFKDRNTGIGYQSRMRASDRLKDLFRASQENLGFAPFNEPMPEEIAKELVILRDRNEDDKTKKDIDYEETDRTIAMRRQLQTYNEFLSRRFIDISLRGWPWGEVIDLTRKQVHRVFNNRSWEQGGRFYGGWWQNISRDLRRRIVIGEYKTVEIDYSGLHIVLLYAMEGVDYFAEFEEDPYVNLTMFPEGFPSEDEQRGVREIMKQLSLAAINARNELAALRGARNELWKAGVRENFIRLRELLVRFVAFHHRIQKHLSSGIGVKLQYIDSLITEKIIDYMALKEGVPVLPIHDSYVCSVRDEGLLRTSVSEALNQVLDAQGWTPVAVRTKEKMGEVGRGIS